MDIDEGFVGKHKIFNTINQIRKNNNKDDTIYSTNPANHFAHDIGNDSQRSRLNKYLLQSVVKHQQDLNDPILVSPKFLQKDNDHNIFKKHLQSKLQTLFDQQKSLLRNRHDISNDSYDFKRTGTYDKSSILAMDKKIKQLENRYNNSKSIKQTKQMKETQKKKEKKDNTKSIDQLNELKQALYETKLLNEKLNNKLLKRKRNASVSKDKMIKKLVLQIEVLKTEISKVKKQPYVVCPAKVKARERATSSFVSNQKCTEHSILTQAYSQIQELQFRLTRQQKQRLDLEEKNSWLEAQLKKYLN